MHGQKTLLVWPHLAIVTIFINLEAQLQHFHNHLCVQKCIYICFGLFLAAVLTTTLTK